VVFRRHPADGFKGHGHAVAAKEFALLGALHAHGLPVAAPCTYASDAPGGPYLVTEWVPGTTDVGADQLPTALDQMADFLVRLHRLDPFDGTFPALDTIEDPAAAIVPYLPPSPAGRLVRDLLDERTSESSPVRPVRLLHGDYWPGNVMWSGGHLRAVIDWEDSCLGDPLADLATARVELLCRYGHDAMDRFTDRYVALTEPQVTARCSETRLVWELYVSATALASMGSWGLAPKDEADRRRLTTEFFERAAAELRTVR
jgi:aminoglycoside phosphotransferase (APT) family kinase protein